MWGLTTSFSEVIAWVSISFLETGSVSRPSKVVYDRAHSSVSEISTGMINWSEVFKDALWFH
jgi:2-dehydro-3-deoxygluconokinase